MSGGFANLLGKMEKMNRYSLMAMVLELKKQRDEYIWAFRSPHNPPSEVVEKQDASVLKSGEEATT